MHTTVIASIRRRAMLVAAAFLAVGQASAASAVVRTTLSFFSPTDLRQGEVGAIGTGVDPFGDVGPGATFQCCFAVTAAAPAGMPFELRRTFSSLDVVDQIYYFGVSTVAEQDHLVLALDEAFSTTLIGREFGTVFTGFSEAQLIADLLAASDVSLTPDERAAASARRIEFGYRLFDLNAGFGVQDTFALTSFSVGVPAGTGFSRLRAPPPPPAPTPVPEPATWAMVVLGFGFVGAATRRRRQAGVLAG